MKQAGRKRPLVWIWLAMCGLHGLIVAIAGFTTAFRETPFESFGTTALAVPYLLHQAGLPVLQQSGSSGWGMLSPNILGWLLSVIVWLAVYGVLARLFGRLTQR